MRTKQRTPDYGAISRRSIQNDFKRVQRYPEREKRPQIENLPEINAERRVCLLAKIQVITNCVLSLLVNWFD